MLAVEIVLDYSSKLFARCVRDALAPDNRLSKGQMRISTRLRGRSLHIIISRCSRVETMQLTLQDVFRCVKAAEESITLTKLRPNAPQGRRKDKRFK